MIRRIIDFMLYYEVFTLTIVLIPWALGVSIIFLKIVYRYFNWLLDGMETEKRFYWIKMSKW